MRISVVITSYNYGEYIERCLRSLILQKNIDPESYEIIIIDDASTDNTLSSIKKFEKRFPGRIRIIALKENVGVAEASNIGIKESLGQYIVRVDADDYVKSNFLFMLSSYLEANNGLLGVACDFVKVDDDEIILGRGDVSKDPISCAIMYRRDMLIKAGLYNPNFRHCEEKELRARLGDAYRIDHLKIPMYRYRMHKNNKTKQLEEYNLFDKKITETYLSSTSGNENNQLEEKLTSEKDGSNPALPLSQNLPLSFEEKMSHLHIIAIIPARGGSKRLPRKNIYPVWGKPMVYWPIEACHHSHYIKDVFVSTEDPEIKSVATSFGAKVIDRPSSLSDDKTEKQRAICHAFKTICNLPSEKTPDIVISLQANSPDIKPYDLDAAIEKLVRNDRWEILSMDENLLQNGVFRIQKNSVVCNDTLSAVTGAYIVKCANIHDLEDVLELEKLPPPSYL